MKKFNTIIEKRTSNISKKKYHTMYNNNYYFRFWIVAPLIMILHAIDVYKNKRYTSLEWNVERVEKILNYAFPEICDIDRDNGDLSFCYGWTLAIGRKAKFKDKEFCGKFDYEIRNYIRDGYQIQGYQKHIEERNYDDTYVVFTKA